MGKIVLFDFYLVLGIFGVVQYLVGMKNSKWIVVINNDCDVFIFEVADYGLVVDIYEVVLDLISKFLGDEIW